MRALTLGLLLPDPWVREVRASGLTGLQVRSALLDRSPEELQELNLKVGELREQVLELGIEYRSLEINRLREGLPGFGVVRINRLTEEIVGSRKEIDSLRKERK